MGKPRILIAGAGIGGIVAALALLQRGFEVALYEQAAELRELGAGVQISPNGSRVLRALGLQPAMEAIASVPTAKEMRLFNTGQAWRVQDLGANAEARYGSPYWLVHRGDFHAVLVQALAERAPDAVRVGARCIGFEQDADGVTLLLESGERVRGDALIGADGVHSRIREALFGGARATFTGFMAWRGVVPMDRLPARLRQQYGMTWIGPHGHVVTYPLRRGELLNFVTAIERDDWLIESWSEAGTVEECRRDLARWHADVLAIVDAIDIPYKWAMLGREPLRALVGRARQPAGRCVPSDAAVPGAGRQHGDRGRHGAGALPGRLRHSRGIAPLRGRAARSHIAHRARLAGERVALPQSAACRSGAGAGVHGTRVRATRDGRALRLAV